MLIARLLDVNTAIAASEALIRNTHAISPGAVKEAGVAFIVTKKYKYCDRLL